MSEDINEIVNPESLLDKDYDAFRDNEDGEDPVEAVGLDVEDFEVVESKVNVLDLVKQAVNKSLSKSLGGSITSSQLRSYCLISVDELQKIEDKELNQ